MTDKDDDGTPIDSILEPPARRRTGLRRVYDFGLSPEEVALRNARKPPTEAEIAAMIVDEGELKTLGRWGGSTAPRRRRPGR